MMALLGRALFVNTIPDLHFSFNPVILEPHLLALSPSSFSLSLDFTLDWAHTDTGRQIVPGDYPISVMC